MERLDRKLAQFQKITEIAESILHDTQGFLGIQKALEITTTLGGFEMIVDDQLLNLEKKAHALTQVFSDDFDPEGRVCSICGDNPCCCTTGKPIKVITIP